MSIDPIVQARSDLIYALLTFDDYNRAITQLR